MEGSLSPPEDTGTGSGGFQGLCILQEDFLEVEDLG